MSNLHPMHRALFQTLQTVGRAGARSPLLPDGRQRLIHGDCLEVLRALPGEQLDLIYIDPPFFTGKDFHLHNGEPGSVHSFTDTWADGLQEYLDWLQDRLVEMRRLLQPEGALLVHLDWHAVHYVKVMLDHLFGYRCFRNEFIWYYSGGGASRRHFARKHDTILYYTRSATAWKFHADRVREPHKWTKGQRRADGSARDYARGKLPDDVWQHHALMPWATENHGYPTQKPEALLQRLLAATTDAGDAVGDFFCGSGTTPAVAQQMGRRWVAADRSRIAVCLAAERVAELLVPGCIGLDERRARARARERYDRILAAPERVGLDATALQICADAEKIGFAVEALEAEG